MSPRPTMSRYSRPRATASSRDRPSTYSGASITLPSAVLCGNRLKCWNTMPILPRTRRTWAELGPISRPCASCHMDSPSISIAPLVGRSRVISRRSKVDLPEPDGPITETVWPAGISRSMPRSTSRSPYRLHSLAKRMLALISCLHTVSGAPPGVAPPRPPPGSATGTARPPASTVRYTGMWSTR
ncbi:Uncharacterised protein [Bordetella pertussis]|nr:Uncharacterised protein [Bordetella pertussis]